MRDYPERRGPSSRTDVSSDGHAVSGRSRTEKRYPLVRRKRGRRKTTINLRVAIVAGELADRDDAVVVVLGVEHGAQVHRAELLDHSGVELKLS